MNDFLKRTYFGNTIQQYALFLLVFLAVGLVLYLVRKISMKRVRKRHGVEGKGRSPVFVSIEKRAAPIIYLVAAYLSTLVLNIDHKIKIIINIVFSSAVTLFGILLLCRILDLVIENKVLKNEKNKPHVHTIRVISSIAKVLIWGIAVFTLLDNLGVNITSLVAGLGIGGIAIALAAQTILGDLFSCFVIYLDKPFEIGDFIVIDDYAGTIEHIGIKTTRIRSLSGEQLVFSNSDLTRARLRNYKRMERRRINFKISVTYETEKKKLEAIPETIKGIIGRVEGTTFDRAHFFSYGEYGLVFDIVYYVESSDYNRYMDLQQEINLGIKEELEKAGVDFAYPTQTVYMNDAAGKPRKRT